jgi:hypothetical protein
MLSMIGMEGERLTRDLQEIINRSMLCKVLITSASFRWWPPYVKDKRIEKGGCEVTPIPKSDKVVKKLFESATRFNVTTESCIQGRCVGRAPSKERPGTPLNPSKGGRGIKCVENVLST